MKKNLSIVLLVMIVAGLSFLVGRFSQPSQLEVYQVNFQDLEDLDLKGLELVSNQKQVVVTKLPQIDNLIDEKVKNIAVVITAKDQEIASVSRSIEWQNGQVKGLTDAELNVAIPKKIKITPKDMLTAKVTLHYQEGLPKSQTCKVKLLQFLQK